MTSIGFHYFPDESHYRAADLQAWLPELRALGARWLTLAGSTSHAIPEAFIRGLVEAGITPIVHLPVAPIGPVEMGALASLFQVYARWGIKYVVLFAEPNARASWNPVDWGKTALPERFVEMMLPVLRAQAEAGLEPVLPPLQPGGEFWDTSFLEAVLASLARRGADDLARRLTFAVNLWAFNRPADWGAGGLARWPTAKPYLTPPGTQDQRGFHAFDWYNEIIAARLGELRPLLCLAGGPRLGDQTDPARPPVDEARHESCIEDILRAAAAGVLPANLLNINFWLLAANDGPFAPEAWYRPDGRTLPAVEVVKRHAAQSAKSSPPLAGPAAKSRGRPIRHYLLLPTFEWGISEWHWQAALKFVQTHQPTCGFSAAEAAQAERVTIFGNVQGVSSAVEEQLKHAGCAVERVISTNG